MRFGLRIAAAGAMLALNLLPLAPTASAQMDVTGHLYVNDNTAGTNTIAAFDRHADGTLSPIAGSPFATGGAGTGTIVGSQGALQQTADGKYLIAVNAGSNDISVLAIAEDGSLAAVEGGTLSSGGVSPISIAVHDDLIYVANAGDGTTGSNYSGLRLGEDGTLTAIEGSTVELSATAAPGQVLFNGDGSVLIGVEVGPDAGPSAIDSFTVNADGTLTAAPGSPFASQAIGPFGSVFSPTNPNLLFVTNAHAGQNHGSVSVYNVGADGALTPVAGSPFVTRQTGTCWIEISPDGAYLFAVNTGSSAISRFQVDADGGLTLLGNTSFNDPSGLRPFDARIAADGAHLYTVDAGAAAVSVFNVTMGELQELTSSPVKLPAGATPFGIVVS